MNFRFMLFLALTLMVSSSLATYVFISANLRLIMIFVLILVFAMCLILAIFLKTKFICTITALLIFASVPFLNLFIRSNALEKYEYLNNTPVVVYGRVAENYSYSSGGSVRILLDDVTVYNGEDTTKLSGKVLIYSNVTGMDFTSIDIGRYITASARLEFNHYTNDSYDIYYLNNGIIATTYVYNSKISFTDEIKMNLKDNVKSAVYDYLEENKTEYADVGYAMLFGDDTLLDPNIKASFRNTGIAHLLAVSGLHVSIIIMVIDFILKKMKCSTVVEMIVLFVLLGFYCYLCDFSVSVIRASLMALFALYAKARGKAYDNLSVLALIASAILLVSPLQISYVSFILSFSAVHSIILLSKPIYRGLSKIFYPKFASTLALNISVQLGLLLTNIYFFNTFNPLSIICNLISVPLATIAFVILIVSIIVGLIFPFMSFVTIGYEFLMDIVVKFNTFVSSLDVSVSVSGITLLSLLYVIVAEYLLSDHTFMEGKTKVKLCLLAYSVCNLIAVVV